jgi:tetratricopeptide (TPR) repeat protein
MNTSLQLLQSRFSQNLFRESSFIYEDDLMQGAVDGWEQTLGLSFQTPAEAINAIQNQMRLLEYAREFGVDSYFGYRMGVLGSLVADLHIPYGLGLGDDPRSEELRRRIASDVDDHISTLVHKPIKKESTIMRSPATYFSPEREFVERAMPMVAADYSRGKGYNGYLRNSASSYFARAARGVADVWNTLLIPGEEGNLSPSARQRLTWYFVDGMRYLLLSTNNTREADHMYESFASVNPGLSEAYERVGDYYFESGQRERGVEEWRQAMRLGGSQRQRVVTKLGDYYIDLGEEAFAAAETNRETPERLLNDAIFAFRQALEVNPGNPAAADLLAETRTNLRAVSAAREEAIQRVTAAEKAKVEGDAAREGGLFEQAIASYQKSIELAQNVTDAFRQQQENAEDIIEDARDGISEIRDQALENAQNAVDDGEALLEDSRFEDARSKFRSVPEILTVVPTDPPTEHTETKLELIEEAEQKLQEVDRREAEWRAEQERLQNMTPEEREAERERQQQQAPPPGPGGPGEGPGAGDPMDPFMGM